MQLKLTPAQAANPAEIRRQAGFDYRITKRSIDARGRQITVILTVEPLTDRPVYENSFDYRDVSTADPVVVVGAGPAGLFAALRLIELGLRPIIVERGREVLRRKQDIAALNRNTALDPESNYCFGQGGAGTFSDGKLFTRSKKRGNNRRILEIFHAHGADDAILFDAHPHIGTDRLPEIIRRMTDNITAHGGSVLYEARVESLIVREGRAVGVRLSDGRTVEGRAVILATGHSANDIYYMLHDAGIALEAKGFALGLRVEHPQELINRIQYHNHTEHLPAAAYNLVTQADGRGVYSFCMCPGGHIVPAGTRADEIVVNGMSSAARNSPFANSGIVVELRPEDYMNSPVEESDETEIPWNRLNDGPLAGLAFRHRVEHLAYINGGSHCATAPASRLTDFVEGRLSFDLPRCSYLPGIIASPLHFWLPEGVSARLRQGFRDFGRKMPGFLTRDAVVVGVESRTSSPVRIPRTEAGCHPALPGLYPAGEGSGYAGGITSSAVDGALAAEAVAAELGIGR